MCEMSAPLSGGDARKAEVEPPDPAARRPLRTRLGSVPAAGGVALRAPAPRASRLLEAQGDELNAGGRSAPVNLSVSHDGCDAVFVQDQCLSLLSKPGSRAEAFQKS